MTKPPSSRTPLNILVVALVLASTLSADAAPKPSPPSGLQTIKVLNVTSFYDLWRTSNVTAPKANITFLDVRPQALFQISHVPGARSVPSVNAKRVAAQSNNKKKGVDPTKDVACYCTVGSTALAACQEFAKLKAYAKVKFYVLNDGFTAWVAAGYPVQTGRA